MNITKYHSSRKVVDFTYQSPDETLEGSPPLLDTSEPGTGQVVFTVASGHLPTFSIEPYSKKWTGLVYGVCKAVTAATISYRMKKNSVSVATGTQAVLANYYFTLNCFFYDVAINDVLEIAFWSNQTDSTYNYKAMQIQVSRYAPFSVSNKIYQPISYIIAANPVLTLGNPQTIGTDNLRLPFVSAAYISSDTNLSAFIEGTWGYGLFYVSKGDVTANTVEKATNATYYPRYNQNRVPTQIIYRTLNL